MRMNTKHGDIIAARVRYKKPSVVLAEHDSALTAQTVSGSFSSSKNRTCGRQGAIG
jgi:hypothetical protein